MPCKPLTFSATLAGLHQRLRALPEKRSRDTKALPMSDEIGEEKKENPPPIPVPPSEAVVVNPPALSKSKAAPNPQTTDVFARTMAILSLVVAVATVGVSYFQFGEQKRQFQVLQSEELTLRLNSHADGPLRITRNNFGQLGFVVQVPWRLTVSNTGNVKLSITEYSITTGSSPDAMFYTGIDGGMLTQEGKAVDLPMVIEPGDSRILIIYVGILVPTKVHEILSAMTDSKPNTALAVKTLAKQGLDLYGNKVNYAEYPGGESLLTIEKKDQNSPTFWYRAVTGRGNAFLTSATSYGRTD
jgi:hypothetical protein